ncbi:MAG: hypothetical protein ACLUSV_03875 [Streptococcus sp.]
MTFIIESLFAVFKDFHWLVSIDTLLIFFVNYLMFHAAGRVKISWRLLLLGGLLSVVLTPLLPMGFKFLLNPLILFCFSYYKRPDLPWIEPVFNSFYAWGTTNIIIRGLSLIVFPLLLGGLDQPYSRIFNGVYLCGSYLSYLPLGSPFYWL